MHANRETTTRHAHVMHRGKHAIPFITHSYSSQGFTVAETSFIPGKNMDIYFSRYWHSLLHTQNTQCTEARCKKPQESSTSFHNHFEEAGLPLLGNLSTVPVTPTAASRRPSSSSGYSCLPDLSDTAGIGRVCAGDTQQSLLHTESTAHYSFVNSPILQHLRETVPGEDEMNTVHTQ